MARRKGVVGDAGLREYLLEQALDFRDTYGLQLEDKEAWSELTKPVDQLVGGEPFRLYGWELPTDHPAWRDCDTNTMFVLGNEDVLHIDQETR